MRLALLAATGIAAVAAVTVWRSRHGVEVWHVAAAPPAEPITGP
ncbi:hypothetical protein [Mycolicibacterium holsaticum]|jgi:hypothetical protein|nr:hypothetical protein [Mycolicibacterium holsaticum]